MIPAGPAFFREIVAPDDLGTVSGWTQISGRVARLLGAPLGGILVAWAVRCLPWSSTLRLSWLIAAVTLCFVQARYRLPRATHDRWRETFTDGFGYVRATPVARIFVIEHEAL